MRQHDARGDGHRAAVGIQLQRRAVGQNPPLEGAVRRRQRHRVAAAAQRLQAPVVEHRHAAHHHPHAVGGAQLQLRLHVQQLAAHLGGERPARRQLRLGDLPALLPQPLQLPHRRRAQRPPAAAWLQLQGVRNGHALAERHARHALPQPGDLQAPAILRRHVAPGLGGVAVAVRLQLARRLLRPEGAAVERAHQVGAVGAPEYPLALARPLPAAARRQRKQLRALGGTGQRQLAGALPLQQVGRREDGVVEAVQVERHHPALGLGVPDHLGVAVAMHDVVDYRVAVVLAPGVAAVGRDRQALGEGARPGGVAGGVDGDHRGRAGAAQAGGVGVVHHRAAGGHGPQGVGVEGDGELGPVHQVAAHGVAPVQVAPLDAVGVVLVQQMVLAAVVEQAVGVVVPAAARGEVELRPQPLPVQLAGGHRFARQPQPVQGSGAGAFELHREPLPAKRLQVAEHRVVAGPVGQVDVEVAHHLAPGAQAQVAGGRVHGTGSRRPAHRQDQVAPVDRQLAGQQGQVITHRGPPRRRAHRQRTLPPSRRLQPLPGSS